VGNPGCFLEWRDLVEDNRDEWEKKNNLAWMKGMHGMKYKPVFGFILFDPLHPG